MPGVRVFEQRDGYSVRNQQGNTVIKMDGNNAYFSDIVEAIEKERPGADLSKVIVASEAMACGGLAVFISRDAGGKEAPDSPQVQGLCVGP